ncbi:MAG: TolC family protein [Flavobacteriales bacterium]
MNRSVLCILALCGCITLQAQVKKISLEEAVETAKTKSLASETVHRDVRASVFRYRSAKASLFPTVSLNGDIPGFTRGINPITQPDGTVLYVPQSLSQSFVGATLSQEILPTGGRIYLGTSMGRVQLFNSSSGSFWQATPFYAGLTQPILQVNRTRWNWKNNSLAYRRDMQRGLERIEQISADASNAFFDWYIAELQLQNARTNVRINDTLYLISQGRFNVGKIAETELLQVELSLLNAQAAEQRALTDKEISEQRFRLQVGIDASQEIALGDIPEIIPISVDTASAVLAAYRNRSDVLQWQIDMNNALIDKRDASYKRFFSANLNFRYGLNQTDPVFRNAYTNLLSSQTFSLGFSIPLSSAGVENYNYKAANENYYSAQKNVELQKRSLAIEVKNAALTMKQLELNVLISKKAYDIGIKRYELSKNRYLVGKIDITNLTIAQNEKDQALVSYAQNLRNYWTAYFQLRRLTLFDFRTGRDIEIQ